LAQVAIRHTAKERAGSFLKRPALLFAISRPKRTREITFGGFEDLPPGTLPRDVLKRLFAYRRLQNKSGQNPSIEPRCNKLMTPTTQCFCHDPPLRGLALEFRKRLFFAEIAHHLQRALRPVPRITN
jgi:hypothetical protein